MRVVIAALLSALFIICTSAKVKTFKKKTSVPPVVTVGYLLYEPKAKNGKNNMWESQFNSSVDEVHEHASQWIWNELRFRLKLETWNITKVDQELSSELDHKTKDGKLVNPYTALGYVANNVKRISNPPDILCLVTKKQLTDYYKDGFGLYHPLCKVVVPLILTYDHTNIKATGKHLAFYIRNTLNITNYKTWYELPPQKRKQRFDGCQIQREKGKQ
uniref:Putative salivary secreted peptide n=1 Tax=Ixodes ricinus TaxID=34613 RepID=A0A6B0V2C8_IXORI